MLRRLLIIDEIAASRLVLQSRLHMACYHVQTATSLTEGLQRIAQSGAPDLILLSDRLLYVSGLAACEALRRQAGLSELPVLALLAQDLPRARLDALLAGANDVWARRSGPCHLLPAQIRCLLRLGGFVQSHAARSAGFGMSGLSAPPPPVLPAARIALVSPHRALSARWQASLSALLGDDHLLQMTLADLLQGSDPPPDAILMAEDSGTDGQGLTLLADLKTRGSEAPLVCWIASGQQSALAATALDLGADCLLPAQFTRAEAVTRLRRLIARQREGRAQRDLLQRGLTLALTDPLTGLSNRRHALPALERLIAESRRLHRRCAVMLLDLDHFKSVNDTFGHPAGDHVLVETARRLRAGLLPEDLIARYGGEEFLIAAPLEGGRDGHLLADQLRRRLSGQPFALPAPHPALRVSASIGLSLSAPPGDTTPEALLQSADQALLGAKRAGRDQVRLACPIAA